MTNPNDPIPTIEPDADLGAPEGFAALGLDPRLLQTIGELGYEEPTPIQRAAIPPLLAGRDVVAEAPTGTGKTAAFALPALQRLAAHPTDDGRPRALVLVPTRELAMQVAEAVHRYGRAYETRVLPIYGGQAIGQQIRTLRRGVDVVVATPGRAVDHLTRETLTLGAVEVVVLDEADEMLDMGFAEDLDTILGAVPKERQTALFSATISAQIAGIAQRHQRDPERVTIPRERRSREEPGRVRQLAYVVFRSDKPAALARILDVEDPGSALVFGRTRLEVDELTERLASHGHDVAALHGGMAQEQRDRVMARFRDGSLDVLVATDLAARGLDIEHVSHVVNYDIPSDPGAYLHRIGRTGRAGREGTAITLVEPREQRLLRNIEAATSSRLELGQVPTVADLRERRFEQLRESLREALLEEGLDRYRPVIEPLADEFDVFNIALAAVNLVADATSRDDKEEIDIAPARFLDERRPRPGPGAPVRPGRPRFGGEEVGGPRGLRVRPKGPSARLFVGAGRRAGIRPGDLVGAIANEAGVRGDIVGSIQVADTFSLVEVPEAAADEIVRALQGKTLRGRKFAVRRYREP